MPATSAPEDRAALDRLFARLADPAAAGESDAVESGIWMLWMRSGDDATDRLLAQGTEAMGGGNFALALTLFNSVIERAPDFAEGWNKRATLYYLMGMLEQSIADCGRVLALEPRHFGALSGLGLINLAREDQRAALRFFEAAGKVHPHSPSIRHNIQFLRQRLGDKPT
ncbi:MAG: hypothetical protein FJX46_13115 [Alphaproteobacteria bacterium]|nr:hypothetical protein [Alphaproteobacteria bacterium]